MGMYAFRNTYFAVVSNELDAMARINFAGTKVARFDTHYYFIFSTIAREINSQTETILVFHVERV